jgi:hypothetical protein
MPPERPPGDERRDQEQTADEVHQDEAEARCASRLFALSIFEPAFMLKRPGPTRKN